MVQAVLIQRRPLAVFIAVLLSLLVLMSYQVTDRATGRTLLGSVIFRVFSPIQSGTVSTVRSATYIITHYFYLVGVEKENTVLRKQLTETRVELAATLHEQEENNRLRAMLDLRQQLPYALLAGQIVGRDARAGLSQKATVNRGAGDGVRLTTPVTTARGIVGMTVMVAPTTSQVQLITDAASSVGAMLEQGKVSGILAGADNSLCILRFLPISTDLRRGDLVVTSGQDGVFPQGLRIGRVTRQLHESEYYKSVEVQPFENFSTLQEVVLILSTETEKK